MRRVNMAGTWAKYEVERPNDIGFAPTSLPMSGSHINQAIDNSWMASAYVFVKMIEKGNQFKAINLTSEVFGLRTRAIAEKWVEGEIVKLATVRDRIEGEWT
jgi:hypothetical protein